tara:strand:- start:1446 stop:1664 length:219 start_codon:yes stop_codon:yes gene_type:complete
MIPDSAIIKSVEVEGIDPSDYPDFCDAYISYAEIYFTDTNGNEQKREATEEELDELNNDSHFVHELVWKTIF